MRRELAGFRGEPDPPQPALLLGLKLDQRRLGPNPGNDGARPVAAEPAEPVEAHGHGRPAEFVEGLGNVVRDLPSTSPTNRRVTW